jgi:hypothetical protein
MASILPLPHGVVGEFVGRAHVDLARVTELLNRYPTLLNASFDWGNGDWESALGAAAHSGRKDIAEFLVSRGARIDIFAAATLGKMSLLKAFLHESPAALHATGPHGIPLIDHAKKGGNHEVISYLNHLLHPEKKRPMAAAAHTSVARTAKSQPARKPKQGASKPKRRKAA